MRNHLNPLNCMQDIIIILRCRELMVHTISYKTDFYTYGQRDRLQGEAKKHSLPWSVFLTLLFIIFGLTQKDNLIFENSSPPPLW